MIFIVQLIDSRDEVVADAMLLVEVDSTLDGLISKNVTMSKVFSYDTTARLLLLSDLVAIPLGVVSEVATIILGGSGGANNLDLGVAKLGVVEKESGLCSGLLLKGHGRVLGFACRLNLEAGDLATVMRS